MALAMPLKQSLKKAAAATLGRWRNDHPGSRVVVLCYHSVHPSKPFASANPELFEAHLRWVKQHCDIIRFAQARETVRCGDRQKPAVAITFDDGYADNYEHAFPLLAKYGISAIFFLTAGLLEKDAEVLHRFERIRRAPREDVRPLEWAQVREMRSAGMDVGTHTYSHPNLARLDPAAAARELAWSKQITEQQLGEPVRWMAYPFGKPRLHFTPETQRLAAAAEYESAAAVLFRALRASDSQFATPRFFVARDGVATLAKKVLGAWDFLGWWQESVPQTVLRLVSPQDFIH